MASFVSGRNRVIALAIAAVAVVVIIVVVALLLLGGNGASPDDGTETVATAVPETTPEDTPAAATRVRVLSPSASPSPSPTAEVETQTEDLPWQSDGVNDLERGAAESLEQIEEADPTTAELVTNLHWLSDDLTLEERLVLPRIGDIAAENPELARSVAQLPWLQDEIDDDKLIAVSSVSDIAREDGDVAERVVETPWVADGVNEDEQFVLEVVRDIAAEDPELARRVLDSPDVSDGISSQELADITGSDNYYLELIRREYPAIWEIIREYSWISDALSQRPAPASSGLLASPLYAGELSRWELGALSLVSRITAIDPVLGERVASLSWFGDGITYNEYWSIYSLYRITGVAPSLANQIAELSWFIDGIEEREPRVLSVCWLLAGNDTGQTQLLFDQPWFRDSITEEEFALTVALRSGCQWNPFFLGLIENGQVRSQILTRPSGAVNLFAVSRSQLGQDFDLVFRGLRTGIDAIEEFMGPPWNTTDVIVYLEPELGYIREVAGLNYGTHIAIRPAPSSDGFRYVLYHELAHFYFGYRNAPYWLAEGGANFLESYSLHAGEGVSMESRFDQARRWVDRSCAPQGVARINDLIEAAVNLAHREHLLSTLWVCNYPLGESFLLGIYNTLGHELVSSSMRDIYQRSLTIRSQPSEEEIYETFLSNTPEEARDEFRDLYLCLHGRPIPGYVSDVSAVLGIPCPEEMTTRPTPSPEPTSTPTPTRRPTPSPEPTATLIPVQGSVDDDRAALVVLFNETGGPDWANSNNWLTNAPLGEWHGVSTDGNGRVVALELGENRLEGRIPPEIGHLSRLEVIFLNGNRLVEKLPATIGRLSELHLLNISQNQLDGPIPGELGSLAKLQSLNLFENRLTGTIPTELTRMTHLKWLNLGVNQLEGRIPAGMDSLTGLESLDLGNNRLTGPIPSSLGQLADLQYLTLFNNRLTGSIPQQIGDLAELKVLQLSGNQLSGDIPTNLGKLENLIQVDLEPNQLSGCVPRNLGEMEYTDVNTLNLPFCGTSVAASSASDRSVLVALYNATNGARWTNNLNWMTDAPIGDWYGVSTNQNGEVTEIDLSGNELRGTVPPALGQLDSLRQLRMDRNELRGTIPVELGNLSNLEWLVLDTTRMTGSIPPQLGNLSNLTWLSLSAGRSRLRGLTGEIPPALGNLSKLNILYLARNDLSGTIPAELSRLSDLAQLGLEGNRLTGELPSWLGELSELVVLGLADNLFTGSVPIELGELNLDFLFISGSHLTGCVPDSFRFTQINDLFLLDLPFCSR